MQLSAFPVFSRFILAISLAAVLSACGGNGSRAAPLPAGGFSSASAVASAGFSSINASPELPNSSSAVIASSQMAGEIPSSSVSSQASTLSSAAVSAVLVSSASSKVSAVSSVAISAWSASSSSSKAAAVSSAAASSIAISSTSSKASSRASSRASNSVMADVTPPVVQVAFPTPFSTTEGDSVLVRGTAVDIERSVVGVQINGLDATSEDNFSHWQVRVPLAIGENKLNISARDSAGNIFQDVARVTIIRSFYWQTPRHLLWIKPAIAL